MLHIQFGKKKEVGGCLTHHGGNTLRREVFERKLMWAWVGRSRKGPAKNDRGG